MTNSRGQFLQNGFDLLRRALARSPPSDHVLVAIRENQLRATFQGYPVDRYKLGVFVLSAVIAGVAGALLGFQTYLVSAEAVSVPFSGELLAMIEAGFPGFVSILSIGLMAPAGTSPAIIDKIHQDTLKVLALADVRAKLSDIGMEVIGNSPAEFAAVIKTETPQWAKVIKDAAIKPSN